MSGFSFKLFEHKTNSVMLYLADCSSS